MKALAIMAASVFISTVGFGPGVAAEDAHNMIGCLAKGADGTFSLTHVEGGVPLVAITESTADLGPHAGHKVEITGMTVTGQDPKIHSMKVIAMKHLDVACP
jgi:hypothetical protein